MREEERKKGRERRERIDSLYIYIYIICWYSLYYFNDLYVKIEIEMLSEL